MQNTMTEAAGCTIRIAGQPEHEFRVCSNDLLLKGGIDQGIQYPHNCRVGVCGSCKTRLLRGRISPMVDLALSPLTNQEIENGYFLACQAKVRSDLEVEVRIGEHEMIPEQILAGTVTRWERLPGDVVDLRLQLERPLKFYAGQYCNISESGSFVRRSYSIYDAPPPDDSAGATEIGFLIKRLPGGAFSEWLFARDRVGTRMWVHGPYGLMGIEDSDADAIGVAGGTGLAPILSIARDRLARSTTSKFTIVFGVQSRHELFAQDLLQALVDESQGRVEVVPILSDELPQSPWNGLRGLVTEALTAESVTANTRVAFVCGSLPMVNAVEKRLVALGINAANIHADKFMPTGVL